MTPATRTPEGESQSCPICGKQIVITPTRPLGDAPCPNCGQLLWFPAIGLDSGFDFLVGGGVIVQLDVATKEHALAMLVDQLVEQAGVDADQAPAILAALVRREQMGSTAIGCGVAIPHAKLDQFDRVIGIIGHVPQGIDFGSLDGEPVTKLFLLLASKHEPGAYLRALEQIAQALRQPD